jgi:hypothetical protein
MRGRNDGPDICGVQSRLYFILIVTDTTLTEGLVRSMPNFSPVNPGRARVLNPQGADPLPPSSKPVTVGRNNLYK